MDKRSDIIRFGSDGWHARFDDDFTRRNVARVADALGLVWADEYPGGSVYVGYDTRHDGAELARLTASIVASYGLRPVVSEGPCPTPAASWCCAHDENAVGSVVLTASERSCEYGGVLVRGSDGGPVPRALLEEVEKAVSVEPTAGRGAWEERDLVAPYLVSLSARLDREAIARAGLRVVVDPMYGAGVGVLAGALSDLGCDVVEIHVEPREDFGGIHPDPRDPWADACEQAVLANGADLGVLLDGDGDRAAVVDELGRILPPRALVPLLVEHLSRKGLAETRVVTTTTSSACIVRQAERLGLDVTTVPVGFSRMYREFLEKDVLIACEEYGGVSVPDHLRERDGLLVCLLAVELLASSGGRSLSSLVRDLDEKIGTMRYGRRDVRMEPALTQAFRNILPGLNPATVAGRTPVEVSHADGLRLQFEDDAWVLMRPSRTAPVVRVYAEAPTEVERDALLEGACDVVRMGV